MARIEIKIDAKGNAILDVIQANGVDCQALTRAFEEALGTKVDSQVKPDYEVQLDGLTNTVHEE